MVPYEGTLVMFVDHIIDTRIKLGRPTTISTPKCWELLDFIIRGWDALYPEYSRPFFEHMKEVHRRANHLAVSREGEAMIQHQLEIPQRLNEIIMIAFPQHKWSKKFNLEFAKRYNIFAGADRL